ncbi:MAG: hypothetical protein WCB68_05170 [Pyrinomonadaceae bacterium]
MLKEITDQRLNRSLGSRTHFMTTVLLFCAMTLVTSGLWLITGCTQSKKEPGNQEQQTRPREVRNTAQDSVNAREINNQNKGAETNVEKHDDSVPVSFYSALAKLGVKPDGICSKDDPVARRMLEDYGAMFVATDKVMPPPVCMFTSEADVTKYQMDAKFTSALIGGTRIDLQPAAMEALLAARQEANAQGLDITPRGGTEAARRSYGDTLRLWNSRFLPALAYWKSRGRLSGEQITRLRKLPIHDQVAEVLELEKGGIFFSKDFSKSILSSVAAPGASQHISMLALDVAQYSNGRVRRILAQHGWFQTVKSDLPHFTYLGRDEKGLPSYGLRIVRIGPQMFWIPNVDGHNQ